MLTDPEHISEAFAKFYKTLYINSGVSTCENEIKTLLDQINVKQLPDGAKEKLDMPITPRELDDVILHLKNNKTPDPDGYVNEFYKTFKELLSPLLLQAYDCMLKTKALAPSWRDAIIIVIHKEEKDPSECGAYRPISILNGDLCLFTTILSRRLNKYISELIHLDQTRFIPGRYSGNNVCGLLNVMPCAASQTYEAMVLSLDAEKAFDRVSWKYMFQTLVRFGFGKEFITWIRILYSESRSAARVNGHLSESFNLGRSTRQGCPLSPVLFVLCIEPFAQLIRDNGNISGINGGEEEHKISLYADDVLLYLSNLSCSIPALIDTVKLFGYYSGYKINVNKTEAMDINRLIPYQYKDKSDFHWPAEGIKYLGIVITQTQEKLYNANYDKIINKIKQDLGRWSSLPLSLLGQIESIHMNDLPSLLYPFSDATYPCTKVNVLHT
uniref:Reverse transcriptase domain-containing protein n=1 Tax=Paramormyrops kingsleyae TaxID=1676925 RepID=A0A3B3QX57_9TELE